MEKCPRCGNDAKWSADCTLEIIRCVGCGIRKPKEEVPSSAADEGIQNEGVPRRRKLAEMIAAYLFRNGNGDHAKRLVLELEGGRDGGGWSERAVTDRIEELLLKHG